MRSSVWRTMMTVLALSLVLSVSGAFAIWKYAMGGIDSQSADVSLSMNEFTYEPPKCVYITDVNVYEKNPSNVYVGYSYAFPTTFNTSVNATQRGTTVTYRITVYNNTDVHQWYLGPQIDPAYGSNALIDASNGIFITTKDKPSDSGASFNTYDWIPPQTSRDFYVICQFESNALGTTDIKIDFQFGIRMDAVYDGFLAVLNDKTSNHGYNFLVEQFDQKYAETGSTVIGNVGDDKAIFDHIFGEDLTIDVDGVQMPVTVLVERKNVDNRTTGDAYANGGPSGCEYTVYITVDDLSAPGGKAVVYAISYSCKADGTWYQIGELYEGTANIKDYDSTNGTYEGAFDVSNWIATANTYEVDENGKIWYKIGYAQGTEYDKHNTISQIQSSNDQEIYNKIDNSGLLKRAYDVLKNHQSSQLTEVVLLREAFEKAAPYYNNFNNGQEFKIKREAPRSELLPYLFEIQEALDYYNQVHGS